MADKELKVKLSADIKQHEQAMKQASNSVKNFSNTVEKSDGLLKKMFTANILSSAVIKGFDMLKNQTTGLIGEMNSSTKAWSTFEGNLKAFGKSSEYIAEAKKEMQDYAQQTIYSASDMANTFAQLEAVGVKDTKTLVKAFGGLASSAENPKQAMKSLSMQATQMAAKPKVAWSDFKIMLEQAPAGISGVAKAMNISTEQLIANVQSGKVNTQDFFNAMKQAAGGVDTAFQQMATQYKTTDQALEGLQEAISNKLQPAFKEFDEIGKKSISNIIDSLDKVDLTHITNGIKIILDILGKIKETIMVAFASGKKIVGDFLSGFQQSGALQHVLDALGSFKITIEKISKAISDLEVWKQLGTVIGEVVKHLSIAVKSISDFINELDPQIISDLTTVLVYLIGGLMAFKTITGILGKFTGLFKFFGKTASNVMNGATNAVTKSKSTIVQVINALSKGLVSVIKALATGISGAIKSIAGGISIIFKAIALVPPTTWLAISVAILAVGAAFMLMGMQGKGIADILIGFGTAIGILLESVGVVIQGLITTIAATLPVIAQALVTLTPLVQVIIDGIALIIKTISDVLVQLVPIITNAITQIVGAIGNLVVKIAEGVSIIVGAIGDLVVKIATAVSMIIDSVSGLLTAVSSVMDSIANVIRSVGDSIKSVFEGIGTVFESVGNAIRTVLDGISGIINSVGDAFEKFGIAIERIGNVAGQLPVAAVGILALSAAIAGMGAASWAGNLVGVSNDLANLGNNVMVLNTNITGFVAGLSMLSASFLLLISSGTSLNTVFMSISNVLPIVSNAFLNFVISTSNIQNHLKELSVSITNFINSLSIVNTGTMVFVSSMTQISSSLLIVKQLLQTVSNTSEKVVSSFNTLSGILQNIALGFSSVISIVQNVTSVLSSSFTNSIHKIGVSMDLGMIKIVSSFENNSNKIILMSKTIGREIANNISKGILSSVTIVNQSMRSLMSSVELTGKSEISKMQNIGYMIGQGLAVGMRNALGAVTASANALVQQAERAAKAKAKIHLPSRLFRDSVGVFIGQGVAVGITKSESDVTDAMDNVLSKITRSTANIDEMLASSFDYSVASNVIQDVNVNNDNDSILYVLQQILEKDTSVLIDGREIIRKTGKYYDEYQARQSRTRKILGGVR